MLVSQLVHQCRLYCPALRGQRLYLSAMLVTSARLAEAIHLLSERLASCEATDQVKERWAGLSTQRTPYELCHRGSGAFCQRSGQKKVSRGTNGPGYESSLQALGFPQGSHERTRPSLMDSALQVCSRELVL